MSSGKVFNMNIVDRATGVIAGSIKGCEHCSTREERCILLLNGPGLRWLFATFLLQHLSQSQQAA